MSTRNGKIARLPFELREQINYRLLENEPVKNILIWLSTDSTVIAVLEKLFEGRPITEQNVSEWRQGGYQEWLALRGCLENVRDLSENAARVALTGINAGHLLMVLTASYAELLQRWETTPEIAFNRKLIALQDLTKIALAMRRSEQRDARLEIDRQRIEVLREKQSNKSRSSSSSRSTSSTAHPSHPQAPDLRRPPVPQPNPECSDDDYWQATGPAPYPNYPNASGPALHRPSGQVAPATKDADDGSPQSPKLSVNSGKPDPENVKMV